MGGGGRALFQLSNCRYSGNSYTRRRRFRDLRNSGLNGFRKFKGLRNLGLNGVLKFKGLRNLGFNGFRKFKGLWSLGSLGVCIEFRV